MADLLNLYEDEHNREQNRVQEMRKNTHDEVLGAYARLFATPDGMTVLIDLVDKHYVLETTFTTSSRAVFQEGQRSVVLEMMANAGLSRFTNLMQMNQKLAHREELIERAVKKERENE